MGMVGVVGVGCGGEEPRVRMPAQSDAFLLLRERLLPVLPAEVLVEPDVRWWTDPCPGTARSAVVLGDRCFSGIYYRADGIDVAWRGSIGESAYSHELLHYFLDHSGQDSDPLHAREDLWPRINAIDTALQEQGM